MDLSNKLREAITQNTAVLVIGTGVTANSVKDITNCTWGGLLRNALSYSVDADLFKSERTSGLIESEIELGLEDNSDFLLSAAQKIVQAMGGKASAHFSTFIDDAIGGLRLESSKKALAKTITEARVPIITVNYDTILEQASDRRGITWQSKRKMRDSLTNVTNDIVHLHGVWDEPETIVLTSHDYERIITDSPTEVLRNAFGALNTLIFIGFGAGLSDPHFKSVWNWIEPLEGSGVTHYVLCRKSEQHKIAGENLHRPVIAVPYGDSYDELAPFVRSFIPTPTENKTKGMEDPGVRAQVSQTMLKTVMDNLRDTSVIAKSPSDDEDLLDVDTLVLEPVLLPIAPQQFAAHRNRRDQSVEKLKPLDILQEQRFISMVGEEQCGVSTALLWGIAKKHQVSQSIPINLDYHSLGSGNRPVSNAIRRALRSASAPVNNKTPIPSNVVLAIDNVTVANQVALGRVIADVVSLDLDLVIFGSRPNVELRIQSELDKHGKTALPAYLGRLGRPQAIALARKVVDTVQAVQVAERVLAIASKEGLSRTPLSVILLINGIANDEGWINSVSNTTFLDAFVDSLLGRGALRDDMRLQIDSGGYSKVLERLAWEMIEIDSASISRVDLLVFVSGLVDSLDWTDQPDIIVQSLITKGLLVDRDGVVRFRQSVYLHIFAARATRDDPSLLTRLQSREMYYAPIIRHYAALSRKDKALVEWAYQLLDELDSELCPTTGVFRPMDQAEMTLEVPTADEETSSTDIAASEAGGTPVQDHGTLLVGNGQSGDASASEPVTVTVTSAYEPSDGPDPDDFDPYESHPEIERDPFPTSDLEDAPFDIKMAGKINLASNILRDSELIEDRFLKERVLTRVLRVWGLYANAITESDTIGRMVQIISQIIAEHTNLEEEDLDEFRSNFVEQWALFSVFSNINDELSTTKLQNAVSRISNDVDNHASPHLMIPAIMLQIILENDSWDEVMTAPLRLAYNVRAVRMTVGVFAESMYNLAKPNTIRSQRLENFILDFRLMGVSGATSGELGRTRSIMLDEMRLERSKAQHKRLTAANADSQGQLDEQRDSIVEAEEVAE